MPVPATPSLEPVSGVKEQVHGEIHMHVSMCVHSVGVPGHLGFGTYQNNCSS